MATHKTTGTRRPPPKKRLPGRPRKGAQKKVHRISTYFDDEQMARIRAEAKSDCRPVANLVELFVQEALERREEYRRQLDGLKH